MGRELVSGGLQLSPQRPVVVDLAVVHERDGAVLVSDRLPAAFDVDDRKAPHSQPNRTVEEVTVVIGSAMNECLGHPLDAFAVHFACRIGVSDSADPAHHRSATVATSMSVSGLPTAVRRARGR